jgi:hypothetical protein
LFEDIKPDVNGLNVPRPDESDNELWMLRRFRAPPGPRAPFEFPCFSEIDCHDLVIADRRHRDGQAVAVLGDGKVSFRHK